MGAKLHCREKARDRNSFNLLATVHGSEYNTTKTPPEPQHRFEIILEKDNFSLEKFELYKHYQCVVHKDLPSDVSQSSFKRFLCDSPLVRTTRELNGKSLQLGSFHQCYRLNGRLIAMAVLDLLPHGVSAVYFVYHQDYEKWSFGKLSALREAAMALEDGYAFYYMGYYIPSCTKMRYKADYKPQNILDPETNQWNILDEEMKAKLSTTKYVSLSKKQEAPLEDTESPSEAANSGTAALHLLTGVLTLDQIQGQLDLDNVPIRIGKGRKQIVPAKVRGNS